MVELQKRALIWFSYSAEMNDFFLFFIHGCDYKYSVYDLKYFQEYKDEKLIILCFREQKLKTTLF